VQGLEKNKRLDFSISASIQGFIINDGRSTLVKVVLKMMSGFYSLETFDRLRKIKAGTLFTNILATLKNVTQSGLKCIESEEAFLKFWQQSQNDEEVKNAMKKIVVTNIRFQSLSQRVSLAMKAEEEEK
jgi:hypothetical protein